jgi:hypothetical protein
MQNTFLAIALLAIPTSLFAQSQPLACDGRVSTVRVSEIKPDGSISGFMAAVDAHKAWYVAHGITNDEIFATRVILRDEKTREQSYSEKQFMTFHIHGSRQPGPKHDEAYDAFVKLYRANSDIKSEYNICLPNPARK